MDAHQALIMALHPPTPAEAERLDLLEPFARGAVDVLGEAVDHTEDALTAAEQIANRSRVQRVLRQLDRVNTDQVRHQRVDAREIPRAERAKFRDLAQVLGIRATLGVLG